MIAISVFIGIHFGFFAKQQNTTDEYFLGGKSIKTIPVSLSLIASTVSGVTLLAIPPDVYLHGINYFCMIISISIGSMLFLCLFLPVILKLETPNGFEYLKMRFNAQIQTVASGIFIVQIILLNPTMAFIPAVAFSQRLNVHLVTSIICITCIFYTTVGGFKAVIWTDVVQFGGMVISTVTVLYLAIMSVEDLQTVWSKGLEGQRVDIDFTINPTIKDGFWPFTIGAIALWIFHFGIHPACVQKYLAISNRNNAKWACIIFGTGVGCFTAFYVTIGFLLHAIYRGCDPLSSGQIKHSDQLLPYFIVDVADDIPLVKGVFMVGLFSAALSTLSSSFNCLGATIYGDFVQPNISCKISESYMIKLIVLLCGILCLILTFLIDKVGSILTFTAATQGSISGCIVGLFSLGMLFPSSNSKGAMWGTMSSFVISVCITIGHEWYKLKGAFDHFIKPLAVDNCTFHFNFTTPKSVADVNEPFVLFRLSLWYNSLISAVLLIIIGLIVSWCTVPDKKNPDAKLISPAIHLLLVICEVNEIATQRIEEVGVGAIFIAFHGQAQTLLRIGRIDQPGQQTAAIAVLRIGLGAALTFTAHAPHVFRFLALAVADCYQATPALATKSGGGAAEYAFPIALIAHLEAEVAVFAVLQIVIRVFGDERHHATEGVGSIQRAGRTAHDFHLLDRIQPHHVAPGIGEAANGKRIGHGNAVNQNAHAVAVQATDTEPTRAKSAKTGRDTDTGFVTHQILDITHQMIFHLLSINDA
ncbi:hypothetical protein FQR65_LT18510 [Abscondita terminalis]|nr:hypothetical protein FQR65_LT18510 [Abscondita terminalis]